MPLQISHSAILHTSLPREDNCPEVARAALTLLQRNPLAPFMSVSRVAHTHKHKRVFGTVSPRAHLYTGLRALPPYNSRAIGGVFTDQDELMHAAMRALWSTGAVESRCSSSWWAERRGLVSFSRWQSLQRVAGCFSCGTPHQRVRKLHLYTTLVAICPYRKTDSHTKKHNHSSKQ